VTVVICYHRVGAREGEGGADSTAAAAAAGEHMVVAYVMPSASNDTCTVPPSFEALGMTYTALHGGSHWSVRSKQLGGGAGATRIVIHTHVSHTHTHCHTHMHTDALTHTFQGALLASAKCSTG
jgi:hypothetical protein